MRFYSSPFLIVITVFILSCSDETAVAPGGSFETPMVTGFVFRNEVGNIQSAPIGTPNIKTSTGEYNLNVYPNPAQSSIAIIIGSNRIGGGASSPANSSTEVWLVPAMISFNFIELGGMPNNSNYFNSTFTQINIPLRAATITNTNGSAHLNLNGLPSGAYRVYAKINDNILWDNILILTDQYLHSLDQ